MKVELNEYEGSWCLELIPATVEEVSAVVRFALNATACKQKWAAARKGKATELQIEFGNAKRAASIIERPKR